MIDINIYNSKKKKNKPSKRAERLSLRYLCESRTKRICPTGEKGNTIRSSMWKLTIWLTGVPGRPEKMGKKGNY